ncbi:DnaJ domain [Trypanosoma vivax]|uniref:J domain-containing protein n=1 Tax=Trypanosoma vivax (strain Y486) TaxID=1055687 RepID=G0U3C7_TRYVY|nr:hypothetical protein TRVL_03500 [Trypanosoma vivax]KAH8604279.1 DnaJ domain [Trypanosoma vivax]KAH8620949.1 DnaJ domain [Trypanosoma vivax]CCC50783.1 conserved hypothetical protein [Trypanosoma vivax Y486]
MLQCRTCILLTAASFYTASSARGKIHPTAYEVLGVGPTTPFSEVKKRFHKLARFYHPDMPHGDAVRFREINAAYRALRAAHREQRSESINCRSGEANFWARQNCGRSEDYCGPLGRGRRRGSGHEAQRGGVMYELLWLYEGYELVFILIIAIIVIVVATQRCITVYRMTRDKRMRTIAMEEGLPPIMPLAIDDSVMQMYSTPVPQEEVELDDAMAEEMTYYRRATQRRFEDFREFLFIHDPYGVTSRKVCTSRFSVQYVDESLIPKRCAIVREFNSEEKGMRYENIVGPLAETLGTTLWAAPDTQHIAPLVAKGLGVIPMNTPDTAKWTFVEYKNNDRPSDAPSCLLALKNNRFDRLGMCQRITVSGSSVLSPNLVSKRQHNALSQEHTKIVSGGEIPLRNLSVPLELMKL